MNTFYMIYETDINGVEHFLGIFDSEEMARGIIRRIPHKPLNHEYDIEPVELNQLVDPTILIE